MASWSLVEGWPFNLTGGIMAAAIIAFLIYRSRKRRKSLHRRDDGIYVWTDWHGGQRESVKDPRDNGGDWGGDGGGGDGGGGGD